MQKNSNTENENSDYCKNNFVKNVENNSNREKDNSDSGKNNFVTNIEKNSEKNISSLEINNDNSELNKTKTNKKNRSDLFIRLRSGAIYFAVVIVASLTGNIPTMIMLSLAAGISVYEFFLMLRSDAKLPNEVLGILGAAFFPISYYFFGIKGIIFVSAILILCLFVWYVFWLHARIADVCISFFGSFYWGFSLTCLLAIRVSIPSGEFFGGLFIVFLLIAVSVNDGFAYLFGKAFGKHRMSPHISPKKTWEGFFAGMIFSTSTWFLLLIFPGIEISIFQCIIFGIAISIVGVLGDLVESRMKRNSGVKDSGKLMPGHGGLLDRIDSMSLVAIVCALFFFTFGCIPFTF